MRSNGNVLKGMRSNGNVSKRIDGNVSKVFHVNDIVSNCVNANGNIGVRKRPSRMQLSLNKSARIGKLSVKTETRSTEFARKSTRNMLDGELKEDQALRVEIVEPAILDTIRERKDGDIRCRDGRRHHSAHWTDKMSRCIRM